MPLADEDEWNTMYEDRKSILGRLGSLDDGGNRERVTSRIG